MRKTWKNISVIALTLLYVAASSGSLLAQLAMPGISSGLVEVKGKAAGAREPGRPIWTSRRHLPMVKETNVSPVLIAGAPIFSDVNGDTTFHWPSLPHLIQPFYFSTLSDRAPPLT